MEQQEYRPCTLTSFDDFDKNVEACYTDPEANKYQRPCTLEGCVMRISDIIAYLGKDRQDSISVGILKDHNIFSDANIGNTNAEIINNMTVSIIENSYGKPYISMDKEVFQALSNAKKENYDIIYSHDDRDSLLSGNIQPMFELMYDELIKQAGSMDKASILYKHHISYLAKANQYTSYNKSESFLDSYLANDPNDIVVDYMASMTDDYFIELFNYLFPNNKYKINYVGYFD